jgi:hypothetical protein
MYMLHIHEVRSPAMFLSMALQQHSTSQHIVAAQSGMQRAYLKCCTFLECSPRSTGSFSLPSIRVMFS